MSRERNALDAYRSAGLTAREQLDRLLAPAGVSVAELFPDGDGWRLRLVPQSVSMEPPDSVVGMPGHTGRRSITAGVAPLLRNPGESLFAMAQRGAGTLRVSRDDGPGGLCVAVLDQAERIRLLAGTLVGDTVLALRHLGEDAEGPGAAVELEHQYRLFVAESRRLGPPEDPALFASALERWVPGLSRGTLPWLGIGTEAARA
jgi:hypothetical protein